MECKKLLFFGDLAPKYLTGTSISSSIILSELKDCYEIIIVEENDSFQYKNLKYYLKLFNIIKKALKLFFISLVNKLSVFYLVFSSSTFGCIKTLLFVVSVKISSPKTKVVIHLHRGDFFETFYKRRQNRLISKIIFGLSNSVILLSDKQIFEFKRNFPNLSFRILYNSLDIEVDLLNFKKEKTIQNRFIFVSNYFREKGIIDLLKCFDELISEGYDIELDTYGALNLSTLKDEILQYRSGKIRIHESISGILKHEEIRKSKCLILPSWTEGQPLVILEAMANATPVIATNVGYISEMLGEKYEFLCSPKNKDDLKSKIITFLSKPNVNEIGNLLYNRYYKYYSKSRHSKEVLNIFKSL
jgi:glycosyltransferase involved in cell wall biosynthesis